MPAHAWPTLAVSLGVLLAVDLFSHRGGRASTPRAAILFTVLWVAAGLLFNVYVWATMGGDKAHEYLAAYLIEKSLSLDNLFVFLLIFQSMKIPKAEQHTVLSWGIFGALVFRALFVFLGVAAVERWEWVTYVFSAILLLAAIRAFREDPREQRESGIVRFLSRYLPVTRDVDGTRFFIHEASGRWVATPLLVAVCAVELTDIAFAVDSVPAALSVSTDRFIVYSSNAFAILGLRALYHVVAGAIERLAYLHYGLAAVLAFAALKIGISEWVHIPAWISVLIVVACITAAGLVSWIVGRPPARDKRGGRPASAGAG